MRLDPGQIEVVDPEMAAVLRTKTPAERTAMAANLWEYGRDFVLASVRRQHPEFDEKEVQREFLRRFLHEAP